MRVRRPASVVVVAVVGLAAALWGQEAPAPAAAAPAPAPLDLVGGSELRPLIERFSQDWWSLRRFYWIEGAGERLDRLDAFAAEWQARLAAVELDEASDEATIDYVLFRTELEHERQELAAERAKLAEAKTWLPFHDQVVALEVERWAMTPIEGRAAAERVAELAERVETATESLQTAIDAQEGTPPKVVARRAAGIVDEQIEALDSWFEYHDGYVPEFSWWVAKPYAAAKEGLEGYAKLLREKVVGIVEGEDEPLVGDPIGRQGLLDGIAAEVIPYSPEELIAIAEAELAWCEKEIEAAAAEMGFEDWRDALEVVKERHVPPGEQPELVRRVAQEAIDFLDERDLVTIPSLARETWRLEMISAENQKFWPFAYYGGQHMAVAYPTDEMEHRAKLEAMRGNNIHFTRNVAQHELIPGHHLQGFMAQRYRDYRRAFSTPFFGEGWALYWEMTLYELGFPQSPEDRIGMLFWRMHRCARVIVSLGFHLGEMSPEEMIAFLVERIGFEEDNATGEVRRYIKGDYGPLYQCAYLIGGLQLRALRAELVDSGEMGERELHDAVLRQGAMPIELIRAALTGARLAPDHRASWRFAGDV